MHESLKNQLLKMTIKRTLDHENPEVILIAESAGPKESFYRYVFVVEADEESGLYVIHIDAVERTVALVRVVGELEYQNYPFMDSPDLPFPSMN